MGKKCRYSGSFGGDIIVLDLTAGGHLLFGGQRPLPGGGETYLVLGMLLADRRVRGGQDACLLRAASFCRCEAERLNCNPLFYFIEINN